AWSRDTQDGSLNTSTTPVATGLKYGFNKGHLSRILNGRQTKDDVLRYNPGHGTPRLTRYSLYHRGSQSLRRCRSSTRTRGPSVPRGAQRCREEHPPGADV